MEMSKRNEKPHKQFGKSEMQHNLARAIQTNAVDLVDKMQFSESEIPDFLIQTGCITEDECKELRGKPNRKDQVRRLITLIKGRSYKTMKSFLDTVKNFCPQTVENIWEQYNKFMDVKMPARKCPTCELKENVDIKYVIDYLYAKEVIGTSLYVMVSDSTATVGMQDSLWNQVLQVCIENNFKYLTDVLESKGRYSHIANSLKSYYSGKHESICLCSRAGFGPIRALSPNNDINESSTTCSPRSTSSTSASDINTETELESIPGENTPLKVPAQIPDFDNMKIAGESILTEEIPKIDQGNVRDLNNISLTTSQTGHDSECNTDLASSVSIVSLETVVENKNVLEITVPVSGELENPVSPELQRQRSLDKSSSCACFSFKCCRRRSYTP